MENNRTGYRAFILRLWREDGAESAPWRIVLVDPQTGERRAFTDVEQLTTFLNDHIHEIEIQIEEEIQSPGRSR